jgi:hypothetical protein
MARHRVLVFVQKAARGRFCLSPSLIDAQERAQAAFGGKSRELVGHRECEKVVECFDRIMIGITVLTCLSGIRNTFCARCGTMKLSPLLMNTGQ